MLQLIPYPYLPFWKPGSQWRASTCPLEDTKYNKNALKRKQEIEAYYESMELKPEKKHQAYVDNKK